jgi:hypothetical protein
MQPLLQGVGIRSDALAVAVPLRAFAIVTKSAA